MEWWQWAFGGVGGAAAVALIGFLAKRTLSSQSDAGIQQSLRSGDNSQNVQAAGDIRDVGLRHDRPSDS